MLADKKIAITCGRTHFFKHNDPAKNRLRMRVSTKFIRYFERKNFPPVEQLEIGRPTAGSSVEQLFNLEADP